MFCLGQKLFRPRQKKFCLGRWTGHYSCKILLQIVEIHIMQVTNSAMMNTTMKSANGMVGHVAKAMCGPIFVQHVNV